MRAKYINSDSSEKKTSIRENLEVDHHVYSRFDMGEGAIVYAGKEGILGDGRVLISWELVDRLREYFNSKK